jgi:hypothetical protein
MTYIPAAAARRTGAPYPAFLAIGGMVLAFVPGAPTFVLQPELALALFVAPVLLDAAYDASPRDIRHNWVPVASLAVGVVLLTTVAVAFVTHALVPGLPWAAAIALGAIVAPPDAAAATAVLRQVRPPHRIVTILEGESLLNDATALTIYAAALAVAAGAVLTLALALTLALGAFFVVVFETGAAAAGASSISMSKMAPRSAGVSAADIAAAVTRYVAATGDTDFERDVGVELLVEIARLLLSLGHHDRHGSWHIDGVTGPDEYSALADDNVYTNLMAAHALVAAVDAARRHPDTAATLGVDSEEEAAWRDAAAAVAVPYSTELDVHEQSARFTEHAEWDFVGYQDSYPLLMHVPYFDLYRKQVVKQADLVLAMQLRGDAFTPEQKARNFDYYEALTVRDSSLSACTQAVLAAEVGHLDLAYDYAAEAAFMDLHDLEHNTSDGLHMASLAGAWIALVAGFGGMRDHDGVLIFAPRLPAGLTRLAFTITHLGRRLRVETDGAQATYSVTDHEGWLDLVHHGEALQVHPNRPVTRPVPGSSTIQGSRCCPDTVTARPPIRTGRQREFSRPACGAFSGAIRSCCRPLRSETRGARPCAASTG